MYLTVMNKCHNEKKKSLPSLDKYIFLFAVDFAVSVIQTRCYCHVLSRLQ